ncbi:glycine cleavage system protein GcvH [Thiomicrorhabdus sp. ZW0627]|uniref:glycine cleavage system protein GcvH n=1 Tax=Thiomicrorhabdus sp. ZW0627 TaxID=3039774 RepID=UPI002436EF70|nr:glycine cleavage system protein GcvH [Thiomicrorhabdus sp. ZW0627]MDG6773304.1 glycine cleavage system protein GcvH [Thiomicrorhabdus sp. ZW0627]
MSQIKYSEEHEWVEVGDDGIASIGITDFAQAQLGDLVYIELPEEGQEIQKGESVSVIESVKAASELYAPVSGTIVEVNGALDEKPELVNQDAMGNWFIKVKLSDADELDDLMDEADYKDSIE